jgi:hypothetical protein
VGEEDSTSLEVIGDEISWGFVRSVPLDGGVRFEAGRARVFIRARDGPELGKESRAVRLPLLRWYSVRDVIVRANPILRAGRFLSCAAHPSVGMGRPVNGDRG